VGEALPQTVSAGFEGSLRVGGKGAGKKGTGRKGSKATQGLGEKKHHKNRFLGYGLVDKIEAVDNSIKCYKCLRLLAMTQQPAQHWLYRLYDG